MSKGQFEVTQVDEFAERKTRRWKVAGLAVASLAILVAGIATAWYLTPPPMPTTLEQSQALAQSIRFHRLSDEQKQPYLDRIREQFGSLDRDARRALLNEDERLRTLMRSAWFQMFEQRVRQFGLADQEERRQMVEQFSQMRRRSGPDRRPQRNWDPAAMRNRMSDRLANGNPQVTAYIGEMVRERRRQRGE